MPNPTDRMDDGTPDVTEAPANRLGRRLFMVQTLGGVATVALAGTVATVASTTPAEAQRCTDNDPSDARGYGRRCYVRRRRVTDNDPYDAAGRGRGYVRRRRVTDNDPYDAAGRGRGY